MAREDEREAEAKVGKVREKRGEGGGTNRGRGSELRFGQRKTR